jgi:hypothetical protein
MASTPKEDQVRSFISQYADKKLFSTGATLVDFTGVLYNVSGSTKDPKAVRDHKGAAWKKLLMEKSPAFAEAPCYVTHPPANQNSSHPDFSVGGHMTPNKSGKVEQGGVTYLMPLCKWHNSTSKNGIPFKHIRTKMLRLTPDGHFKFPHLWPPKFPRAGRVDY